MFEVILVIHLVLAIAIVAVVLLQRSEGGALGMGGGGSGSFGGLVSGRSAGNFLTKATGGLAAGFMVTSLLLTYIAGRTGEQRSIVDDLQTPPAANQPVQPTGPQVPTSQ